MPFGCGSVQIDPEIAPGRRVCPALLFRRLSIQQSADDLIGYSKALGGQMPHTVFRHSIAGGLALLQKR